MEKEASEGSIDQHINLDEKVCRDLVEQETTLFYPFLFSRWYETFYAHNFTNWLCQESCVEFPALWCNEANYTSNTWPYAAGNS